MGPSFLILCPDVERHFRDTHLITRGNVGPPPPPCQHRKPHLVVTAPLRSLDSMSFGRFPEKPVNPEAASARTMLPYGVYLRPAHAVALIGLFVAGAVAAGSVGSDISTPFSAHHGPLAQTSPDMPTPGLAPPPPPPMRRRRAAEMATLTSTSNPAGHLKVVGALRRRATGAVLLMP